MLLLTAAWRIPIPQRAGGAASGREGPCSLEPSHFKHPLIRANRGAGAVASDLCLERFGGRVCVCKKRKKNMRPSEPYGKEHGINQEHCEQGSGKTEFEMASAVSAGEVSAPLDPTGLAAELYGWRLHL
ncbi:unnamed protein product [Effrenium voratum]|nr:unnamed protein product [Effrenium voratum]